MVTVYARSHLFFLHHSAGRRKDWIQSALRARVPTDKKFTTVAGPVSSFQFPVCRIWAALRIAYVAKRAAMREI
jgi:hypothetical protein